MNFKTFIQTKKDAGFEINKKAFRAKMTQLNALRRSEKLVAKTMCRAGFYGYAPGQVTAIKLDIWLMEDMRKAMNGEDVEPRCFALPNDESNPSILHKIYPQITLQEKEKGLLWQYFCSMSIKITKREWASLVSWYDPEKRKK